MREICQKSLPVKPWMEERTRRLPGLNAVENGDWLRMDEAYAAQMSYREELLRTKRPEVTRMTEGALPAARELLDRVLLELRSKEGFEIAPDRVKCPDGRKVFLDRDQPLVTMGHLIQEDLVLMQDRNGEHALTAAVLCFPASWSLDEKFNHGLMAIHDPVEEYSTEMGNRVQRLFDFIKPEMPMWRANFLVYSNPDLFQPRREANRRSIDRGGRLWVRVERQCLVRLPVTGAVVFSIHSYVVPMASLSAQEAAELEYRRSQKARIL